MPDLTAKDIEAAMKIIAGTARSMGVTTVEAPWQPRSRMTHGKKYRAAVEKVEPRGAATPSTRPSSW